jgi:hypothetical protein
MDALEKFIRLNSYKFEKGYPDITKLEDIEQLFGIVSEIINQKPKIQQGYSISSLQIPTETLESRHWYFKNKTGYLGTGYYFYGDLENAKQDLKTLSRTREPQITKIDLTKYKLYRPDDAQYFYDGMVTITSTLGKAAPKITEKKLQHPKVQEALHDIADAIIKDLGLPLQEATVMGILAKFIRDVRERNNGVLLTNRLLDRLGYEGINNVNTPLDNYGVGSVLFVVKPTSLQKLPVTD